MVPRMSLTAAERSCEVAQMLSLSMPDENFGTDVLSLRDFPGLGRKGSQGGLCRRRDEADGLRPHGVG